MLTEAAAFWSWCEVSFWLCQNDMIRPEEFREAGVIFTINNALAHAHQKDRNPELVEEVSRAVAGI